MKPANLLSGRDVPEPERIVIIAAASRQRPPAVRGECDSVDPGAGVAPKLPHLLARRYVAQVDIGILTGTEREAAIGRERDLVRRLGWHLQLAQFLLLDQVPDARGSIDASRERQPT